jgi:hypothetical protein
VSFGDFAFFAARGSLGNGGGFGSACGFDPFGGGGAGGFFGLPQSTAHGGILVFCLMSSCGLRCVTCGGLRCWGGGFGLGLGEQGLFADLLGGAVP